MRVGKQIAVALVALPVAELVAFILVAMAIGFAAALALMVATSLAGAMVLRHVGRAGIAQFRGAVSDPEQRGRFADGTGLVVALGGILLVLPGFITDVVGAVLVLPWLRPWIRRWVGVAVSGAGSAPGRTAAGDGIVDLGPDEWRQVDDPRIGRDRDPH